MLLPLSWLQDFIDIADTSPEKLSSLLTMSGSEVEKIHQLGGDFANIVVAEITNITPHPNADKLRIATVNRGNATYQDVVCGAPNIAIGQKVPLALLGATIGDITIEKRKIRGVASEGMLCSGRELGIADDHSGIFILDAETPVGIPLADVIKPDIVFDLEITPNRADCFSIQGLAREAAALLERPLRKDHYLNQEKGIQTLQKQTSTGHPVTINAPEQCFRYVGVSLDNINISPSPQWMQLRLLAAGMRPINNVVDITNYVMLETGQPLHAFDRDKLGQQGITVRLALPEENLTTLDGKQRYLQPSMLLIAGTKEPLAIAGVMGGASTEVDEKTTSLLLESATFHSTTIRKTSESLGLRSEASARFEKGVDVLLADKAAAYAVQLFQEIAGATVSGYTDVFNDHGKELTTSQKVHLTHTDTQRLLGISVPAKQAKTILEKLGFACVEASTPTPPETNTWAYTVTIPSYRRDVADKYDLIEEIGRIYGYDNIEASMPTGAFALPELVIQPDWQTRIRQTLALLGLNETYSYALTTRKKLALFGLTEQDVLSLRSPLAEFTDLRCSLLPDLLTILRHNLNVDPTIRSLKLFELSRVFIPKGGNQENIQPDEPLRLSGVALATSFLEIKGILETLLGELGIANVAFEKFFPEDFPPLVKKIHANFIERQSAQLQIGTENPQLLGVVGHLSPAVLKQIDCSTPVVAFELNADLLIAHATGTRTYQSLSKYPPVLFDCAFFVDATIAAGAVLTAIQQLGTETVLVHPTLFDVYTGKGVPAGKKSLAFSIRFIPYEQTLSEEEVKRWQGKVVKVLEKEFSGILRDRSLL